VERARLAWQARGSTVCGEYWLSIWGPRQNLNWATRAN
jgi:hypothetical protein